jgi:hypothetical protein
MLVFPTFCAMIMRSGFCSPQECDAHAVEKGVGLAGTGYSPGAFALVQQITEKSTRSADRRNGCAAQVANLVAIGVMWQVWRLTFQSLDNPSKRFICISMSVGIRSFPCLPELPRPQFPGAAQAVEASRLFVVSACVCGAPALRAAPQTEGRMVHAGYIGCIFLNLIVNARPGRSSDMALLDATFFCIGSWTTLRTRRCWCDAT